MPSLRLSSPSLIIHFSKHPPIHSLIYQSLSFKSLFTKSTAKMQFLAIATLIAAAFAAPSVDSNGNGVARRQAPPPFCPPGLLYSVPQCCDVDVLGLADLDCVARKLPAV